MKKTASVKKKNALHPRFSECSKCGGNWGWKKPKTHMTSESRGLFLFCEECDKIVTKKERWEALKAWKKRCIGQILGGRDSLTQVMKDVSDIEHTEFIEYPREDK